MKLKHQKLLTVVVAVAILLGALVIAQLWFEVFSDKTFFKIIVTLFVLGGLASFLIAVQQDLSEDASLKKDNYIN